jgi:predicted transcriptional regulator YheO
MNNDSILKIDDEIKFHEAKIMELMNEKKNYKSNLLNTADSYKLLSSKKYRIELALAMTDTIKEASKLLGVSERTIYRHLEENNN